MGNETSALTKRGYALVGRAGKEGLGDATLVRKAGNEYIVKIINMTNMSQENKQKTIDEAAKLRDLHNPHVVRYLESFKDDCNNFYVVMDYCHSEDLAQKIQSQKTNDTAFSEDQILVWFVQICLALKHVHDKKLVHRDIKPQNIFLTKNETIKLGEFGFSDIVNRKEEYAKLKPGTPFYFAPEVWKGKSFDNKSDMWALGCVLYELCTLEFAFAPNEHLLFMYELWNQHQPSVPETFSPELRNLVNELLQKDPRCRPSIDKILQKPFLARWIPAQLLPTMATEEDDGSVELCVNTSIPLVVPGNDDNIHLNIDDDRNLSHVTYQLNVDIEKFKELYDQNVGDIEELVKELENTADDLERVHFGTTVGSLTGGVVGAAGGVTSIVGLILAPFTLGASLIVTGVGIGVAVAGGAASAASNVTNMVKQSNVRKNIERIINEYREKMEPILISVEDITTSMETLQENESFMSAANLTQAGCKAGRGLGGIAELVRLVQVVNVGKVAAQAARTVRVAEAFTGVLSALFLALDIYFIAKDAKEIHSIRQMNTPSAEEPDTVRMVAGSTTELETSSKEGSASEVQSATMKVVTNIRELASIFKEKLNELKSIKTELEIVEL